MGRGSVAAVLGAAALWPARHEDRRTAHQQCSPMDFGFAPQCRFHGSISMGAWLGVCRCCRKRALESGQSKIAGRNGGRAASAWGLVCRWARFAPFLCCRRISFPIRPRRLLCLKVRQVGPLCLDCAYVAPRGHMMEPNAIRSLLAVGCLALASGCGQDLNVGSESCGARASRRGETASPNGHRFLRFRRRRPRARPEHAEPPNTIEVSGEHFHPGQGNSQRS